jgi:hypothetical protein
MKNEDLFADDGLFEINGVKIHDYIQTYTSAETCRKQKAYGARLVSELFGSSAKILDFGGGKYSEAQEYLQNLGSTCEVYDPYNRNHKENVAVLKKKYDLMMCNNVLNVLTDDVIDKVIQDMRKICDLCGISVIVVTVYERDKSGIGCTTGNDSYQRNEKTDAYLERFRYPFQGVAKYRKALVVTV